MKRFAMVLAVLMLLPLNAFALQPMSEDNMGQITGQAGVSIAIDDVIMYQNIDMLMYTDADGIDGPGGAAAGGSIGIDNLSMTVNINGITSLDASGLPVSPNRACQGTYTGVAAGDFNNTAAGFVAKALTIDAGALTVLSAGMANNNTVLGLGLPSTTITGVQIGLPTVEIVQSAITLDVVATGTGAINSGLSYGTIEIGQVTMAVLDGVVEIAPHN